MNKQKAAEGERQQPPWMVDRTQRTQTIDRDTIKEMLNAMRQKLLDDGQDPSREPG